MSLQTWRRKTKKNQVMEVEEDLWIYEIDKKKKLGWRKTVVAVEWRWRKGGTKMSFFLNLGKKYKYFNFNFNKSEIPATCYRFLVQDCTRKSLCKIAQENPCAY